MPDTSPDSRRPPKRRFLRVLAVLLLLGVLLVLAAPTLLSFGPAAGVTRNAIADSVNGDVTLRAVRLGWLSGQSVEGLSIRDADGRNAIDVDVKIHNGLLSLAMGGTVDATMSGRAAGTIEPDGSTGLAKLFATTKEGGSAPSGPAGPASPPSGLPAGVRANLVIERFDVRLEDSVRTRVYALNQLRGSASIDGDAGTAKADLRGGTEMLGSKGEVSLVASASNLGGTLDLAKVAFDLALSANGVRVPAGDTNADFSRIAVTVRSPGLGQSLVLDAKAEGTVDGMTPSTLSADLIVDAPIGKDGAVAIDPARVRGTVEAANLPVAIGQPFLAGTDIVLAEDLGPTIDRLALAAPGGAAAPITLELAARQAKLSAQATVGADGSVTGGSFDGTATATPETLKRVAKVDVDAPVRLALRGQDLLWRAPAGDAAPWSTLVGRIEVVPEAPFAYRDGAGYSIAIGSSGALRVGRAATTDPFAIDAAFALGFGGGEIKALAPGEPNLRAAAQLAPSLDRVREATLDFAATLDPAFLAVATKRTFTAPLPLRVSVARLDAAMPPKSASDLSVEARVEIPGMSAIFVEELSRDVRFGDLVATLVGRDPSKEIVLDAKARVDAGSLALRQTLRGLPEDLTNLDPLALDVRGTTSLAGIDGAAIGAWVPTQRALIDAAGIRGLSLELANEPAGSGRHKVVVTLGGEPLRGDVAAIVGRDDATIERLDLAGTMGQDLVIALQGESDSKVKLAKSAPFTVRLANPVTITFAQLADGRLPAGLAARIGLPELVVREGPGLASPVVLRDFDATVTVASAEQAAVKGAFSAVGTTSPSDRIERAAFDLGWRKPTGPTLLSGATGTVSLTGVNVPWVEAVLGQPKGRLATWTGDDGSLAIALARDGDRESVRIEPTFPRLTGAVDVVAERQRVFARGTDIRTRVRAVELRRFVNPPDAPPGGSRYDFENFLAVRVPTLAVELPQGLREGGMSFAGATMDARVETDPLGMRIVSGPGSGQRMTIPGVVATLASQRFEDGIRFGVRHAGEAGGATIAIDGTARSLLAADGSLAAESARLDLDAEVRKLPTVVLDLLVGKGGTIARALGDTIELSAKATNASKTDGRLSFSAKAPYAEIAAPAIEIKEGVVRVAQASPITASFEMSPSVRDELLYLINPVFADVGIVKRRANFALTDFAYPLDGDMRKFNGDFSLDVGEVTFRKGQQFGAVLSLLRNRSATEELEGLILPLAVQVRSGVLSYRDFGVRLGRVPAATPGGAADWQTKMDFRGEIDLTQQPPRAVAITTALPASQVGSFSSDVRRFFETIPGGPDGELARALSIGVTLSGPLFNPDGTFATLDRRITLPTAEDMAREAARDPGRLLEQGIKIFDQLQRDRKR
jgi:hypothetical protein